MPEEFELDADLQAYVEERLGYSLTDAPDVDGDNEVTPNDDGELEETAPTEDEGEEEATPPVAPSEPSPSDPSNIFEVAPGVAITRDQALSYYQFDALLKGRPELAQEITDLVNGRPREGEATQPATSPSLEIPEDYRDDPYVKP